MSNSKDLIKNIGKRCIIKESVVAGLTGSEGKILSLTGTEENGFRYEVKPYEPLTIYSMNQIESFYIPHFLCEILPDNLVTKAYLGSIKKTDIGFLQAMPSSPILCESEEVYDSVMKYFQQLHIGTSGNKETLTIWA